MEASPYSAVYTLTYAFDDFLLSQITSALVEEEGNDDDDDDDQGGGGGSGVTASDGVAALNRSLNNYKNVWSNERRFFCPRNGVDNEDGGQLQCPLDPASLVLTKPYYKEGEAATTNHRLTLPPTFHFSRHFSLSFKHFSIFPFNSQQPINQ